MSWVFDLYEGLTLRIRMVKIMHRLFRQLFYTIVLLKSKKMGLSERQTKALSCGVWWVSHRLQTNRIDWVIILRQKQHPVGSCLCLHGKILYFKIHILKIIIIP